jgi:hypothetical protein
LDSLIAIVFRKKRSLTRHAAKASYTKQEYSNAKIKMALKIDFLDIHHYIKEISTLK